MSSSSTENQEDDLERVGSGRLDRTMVGGMPGDGYVVAVENEEVDVEHRGGQIDQIHEHQPPDPEPSQHSENTEGNESLNNNKSLRIASTIEPPAPSDLHRAGSTAHRTSHTGRGARQQEPQATYGYQPSGRDLNVDSSLLTAHTTRENEVDGRRSNTQVAFSPSSRINVHHPPTRDIVVDNFNLSCTTHTRETEGEERRSNASADSPSTATRQMPSQWKRGKRIIFLLYHVVLLSLLVWVIVTTRAVREEHPESVKKDEDGDRKSSLTLELVAQREKLRCGVIAVLDGFTQHNPDTGILEGFEVDLCRAVAAAVLGDGDKVDFVFVTPTNRFTTLANGDVDLLASHNTLTMDRDVYVPAASTGFTPSVPYLYDGLVFAGQPAFVDCAENGITAGDCEGLSICVVTGTTHIEIVTELVEERLPGANIQSVLLSKDMYERFLDPDGGCNVIAGGQFEVAKSVVFDESHQDSDQEYKVGQRFQSFEPLALMTRDGDPTWSDVVQWVLQALLSAEEQSILKVDAARFEMNPDLGGSFTLQFQNAIAAVGNYGEVYARHLERILPRGDVNKINEENSGDGLIFSHPFGSLDTNGPGPVDGGTLEAIRKRGHLRCGITRTPGFAEFDVESNQWTGFDVDFCKAVASAIFFGVQNIVYVPLPMTERFEALSDGVVDMLSCTTTWNLKRDIKEETSNSGFDFSQVNIYGGIAIGGIPQYVECAERKDWIIPECKELRICVNKGTTTVELAHDLFFDSRVLVEKDSREKVNAALVAGECNAIMSDVVIVEPALRELGFKGNYTVGWKRFSKDPLALVTRQDDPQFSSFVYWIVSATFYAEENAIGQENARGMPLVYLFGRLYGRMLVDAIQSVGNYGDIYARNIEPFLHRQGQNKLSVNPFRARHYPLPGFRFAGGE